MREAVSRFDGTVNKMQGDGIMALFGALIPMEDHAIRACCAALAMIEDVGKIEGAPPIRVGIHTGEVVVRTSATDLSTQYDAMGIAVHLAARLEQEAGPFAALISKAPCERPPATRRRAFGGTATAWHQRTGAGLRPERHPFDGRQPAVPGRATSERVRRPRPRNDDPAARSGWGQRRSLPRCGFGRRSWERQEPHGLRVPRSRPRRGPLGAGGACHGAR